jgi:hypothetical protein
MSRRSALVLVVLALPACGSSLPAAGADDLAAADMASTHDSEIATISDLAATADFATADFAAPPDSAMADLASAGDLAMSGFQAQLEGIWLIGWSGGLNHYSWVRFAAGNPNGGAADLLPPTGNGAWTGFWGDCSGQGQWAPAQQPGTVRLIFPNNCNRADQSLTFQMIAPPMGWPPTAILTAAISSPTPPMPMNGWKFPANQCDAQFTNCTLP